MGFLDRLLKQSARQITSAVVKNATNTIIDELTGNGNKTQTTPTVQTIATPAVTVSESVPAGYEGLADADLEMKLETVLAKEFPQYEIRKEVSPTTIGGTGRFLNYSYGVYENGTPKLFIMLIGNNTCASRYYRWSKEAAQNAGVTLINFVPHFENKITYIIQRLHQYL